MKPVFVIAEAGVNHNGSEDLALELVDVAASSGADAVKFQTFNADKLVARGTATAEYQARETGQGDQHAMLRSLELSEAAHRRIADRCRDRGIEFMSTPFDEDAARMLVSMGMGRIKVPSGEITNLPFLAFLASLDLPMIVSTGMADVDEIRTAVDTVRGVWASRAIGQRDDALTVLHCTSNYPAAADDVHLRALSTIARATGTPVGYSDHTEGIAVSLAAVALGATVIEKHFTLDRSLPGPDHRASLSPDELVSMVNGIRQVERSLGTPHKGPTASELPIRALVRRSVTLTRPVVAGQVLVTEDLTLLRPGTGIPPGDLARVQGCRAALDLPSGTTLTWSHLLS